MKEFNPPIESRPDDELILISLSNPGDWENEAVEKARNELRKRNLSEEEQVQRKKELELNELKEFDISIEGFDNDESKEILDLINSRKTNDIGFLFYLLNFIFPIPSIFYNWSLKREGLITIYKKRNISLAFGFIFWFLLIRQELKSWDKEEEKRIQEIEAVDISKWEQNRLPEDSIK